MARPARKITDARAKLRRGSMPRRRSKVGVFYVDCEVANVRQPTRVVTVRKVLTRSIGYAIVRAAGFETVDEVVIAEPGDLTLLGARALEGFGAVADARRKRLVASGSHPAAPP